LPFEIKQGPYHINNGNRNIKIDWVSSQTKNSLGKTLRFIKRKAKCSNFIYLIKQKIVLLKLSFEAKTQRKIVVRGLKSKNEVAIGNAIKLNQQKSRINGSNRRTNL
jgi:hypothetical protein